MSDTGNDDNNTNARKVMTITPEELMNPLTRRHLLRVAALSGSALMLSGLVESCTNYDTSPGGPTSPAAKPQPASAFSGGDQYMSEIRIFSFSFAPQGWASCNGQLLPIAQNAALFSLLGTSFGGNGQTNFALPDLRSRAPIGFGNGHVVGERAGQESHTVSQTEMPAHNHPFMATASNANTAIPTNNVLGAANNLYVPDIIPDPEADRIHAAVVTATRPNLYSGGTVLTTLHPSTLATAGGSQPHENRQPFLALNFCIAIQGIYPTQ
ncbi:MAG: tail fiber protein [bacterium]